MERKTKQRILGILVVIGLIIIMLPLFQNGKELSTEAAVVKAPPFPDQSVQVATNASEEDSNPPPVQTTSVTVSSVTPPSASPTMPTPPAVTHTSQPPVAASSSPTPAMTQPAAPVQPTQAVPVVPAQPNQTQSSSPSDIADSNNIIENPHVPSLNNLLKSANTQPKVNKKLIASASKPKHAKVIKTAQLTTHTTHVYKMKTLAAMQSPINDNGLANLKNPAWVIQMGSFKNKANALRLVNQLRANGYRAFIQQVSTRSE